MQIIKKNKSSVRVISSDQRAAFRIAYGHHHPKRTNASLAEELMTEIHPKYWLECDCLKGQDDQAIMIPHETGIMHRHPETPKHFWGCPFYRDKEGHEKIAKTYQRPKDLNRFTFLYSPNAPHEKLENEHAETDALNKTNRGRAASRPRLATLLFTLLERSNLNVLDIDTKRTTSENLSSLKTAVRSIRLAPGIRLANYFCTHVNSLYWLRGQLQKNRNQWPDNIRPQGIFIQVVNAIDGNNLVLSRFDDERVDVQCGIPTFGETLENKRRAPYIFIGVIGDEGEPGDPVTFHMAYAHPISSINECFPVDSNYERRTLTLLRQQQIYFRDKGLSENLSISKPLFDLEVEMPSGVTEHCSPDFLLTKTDLKNNKNKIVIETMGRNDDAYNESKAITHPRMERLGPVVEHEAFHHKTEETDKIFLKWLLKEAYALKGAEPS